MIKCCAPSDISLSCIGNGMMNNDNERVELHEICTFKHDFKSFATDWTGQATLSYGSHLLQRRLIDWLSIGEATSSLSASRTWRKRGFQTKPRTHITLIPVMRAKGLHDGELVR